MAQDKIDKSRISSIRADLRRILTRLCEGVEADRWEAYRRTVLPVESEPPLRIVGARRRPLPDSRPADEATACRFDYMTCVEAMLSNLDRIASLPVPPEVKELVFDEFEARRNDGLEDRHERYSLRDSEGWNQLAGTRLQQLPLGIYVFNMAGVPRMNLLRCPTRERGALARFLAFEMGGFAPVFEVHLPRLTNRHVTEQEVDASHMLLARTAVMHPRVKGLYSSAWYIDPAVAALNPRLAFLREFFLENGGFVHRLGVTESSVEDALRKSETRRRLYAEGRYQPTAWARYWPRSAMLRWAGLAESPRT